MRHWKRLLPLLFLIHFSIYCIAGSWNKDKGHGYIQLGFTFLSYDELLNGYESNIGLKRTITDNTLQLYGEYGLSNRFNLIFSLPYKFVSSSSGINNTKNDPFAEDTLESGSLNGLSNIMYGLRYKIYEGPFVLAAQLSYHGRRHQYQPNTGLQIGYDADYFNPSLLFGKGWESYYLQLESGVMLNTGKYAMNALGNLEIGRKIRAGRTLLIFRMDYKMPVSTGTFDEGNSVQTGLFRDNSSFISPGIKIIEKLSKNFYLNLAAYGAIYSRNEGANATLNVGIAYDW